MEEAGDGVALGGRNPQIGTTGVEDDLEGLRGRTNGDLGEVYGYIRRRDGWLKEGYTDIER